MLKYKILETHKSKELKMKVIFRNTFMYWTTHILNNYAYFHSQSVIRACSLKGKLTLSQINHVIVCRYL